MSDRYCVDVGDDAPDFRLMPHWRRARDQLDQEQPLHEVEPPTLTDEDDRG